MYSSSTSFSPAVAERPPASNGRPLKTGGRKVKALYDYVGADGGEVSAFATFLFFALI